MSKTNHPRGRRLLKAVAAICSLCLLLSLGAISASAAGGGKISSSSCETERGGSVSVAINMDENPGIWAIKLRIHYDSSALSLESVSVGSVFNTDEIESNTGNPCVLVCSYSGKVNKTSSGNIVTMNFKVKGSADYKAYPVNVEITQAINTDAKKLSFSANNGSVNVVKCIHSKEWRVTKAATCDADGTETLTCSKCSETFETRSTAALKHKNTEIKNAKAATKTAEGYTGDTYCKDCGKLLSKGKTVEKLTSSVSGKNTSSASSATSSKSDKTDKGKTDSSEKTDSSKTGGEPIIITGKNAVFARNENKSLVFASDAEFSDFIRVEIDGEVLDEKYYSSKSGSTVITVSPEYLSSLSNGEHTVSIVSKSGTASAQFTVQDEADAAPDKELTSSQDASSKNETKSSAPVIVMIIIVILLAGVAAALLIFKRKRG